MSGSSSRRRVSHVIAIAVTALGLGLVAPSGTAVGPSSSAAGCVDTPSHARARAGEQGVDPNSVSAGQVRAMNRQLTTKTDRLAARGIVSQRGVPRGHWHKRKVVRIKTIVHVITAEDGTGAVTRQQVRDQIKVMNDGFRGVTSPEAAPTKFRFVLKKLHYVANDDWFNWEINDDGTETEAGTEAKTALHRGGWRTLNVYVTNLQVYLGYATFPQNGVLALDGLVVLNESLPGGTAAPYNEGDTATHEIGHWLGLFHTFENGCNSPGDSVRDTPYQDDGENIFSCEESLDTCTQPGTDPVHNFMSYGDDLCMDQFTRGQHHRMLKTWFVFRAFR
jgi:Pregnancy-associated plasma protein-A